MIFVVLFPILLTTAAFCLGEAFERGCRAGNSGAAIWYFAAAMALIAGGVVALSNSSPGFEALLRLAE